MKIVLATANRDKIKEIKQMLSHLDLEILLLNDFPETSDVVEDGKTLEENAVKKARVVAKVTGVSALADDSGLEVEALDGAPGVRSSRFAGENASYADNNAKLLAALEGLPPHRRGARFRCCMALVLANKNRDKVYDLPNRSPSSVEKNVRAESREADTLVTEGIIHGRIALSLRGNAGFGYDPLFELPELGKTFAQLGLEVKNRLSHRYRALIEMKELMIRLKLAGEKT